ncbi:MAG: ABC transporter permease subunit, partial [Myxococcota bacterium]
MRALLVTVPLVLFAVGPVLVLLSRAFVGELSFASTVAADAGSFGSTMLVATGAGAVSFVIGAPLSVLLYRTDLPGRAFFTALFNSILAVPPFIWGIGWISLANPKTGFLNRFVPLLDIYSTAGIAFVLGTSGLPLVLLAGAAAFRRVDSSLEEAARMCGASPVRAFLSATFPLV